MMVNVWRWDKVVVLGAARLGQGAWSLCAMTMTLALDAMVLLLPCCRGEGVMTKTRVMSTVYLPIDTICQWSKAKGERISTRRRLVGVKGSWER